MKYDPKVPLQLKKEQIWFGNIVGRPIDEDGKMNPMAPSGELMEVEAVAHIAPSPTLRPAQRVQIYNQQYWWRLLNAMQDSFPLVTRLLGFFDYNRSLSIPYLVKYPPRHWALSYLGDRLHQWVIEDYEANDKVLIADSVALDWAFLHSAIASQMPSIAEECTARSIDPETLSTHTLYIQSHVHLLRFDYNLPKYRMDLVQKDHDYWLANKVPKIEKEDPMYFVLYRNPSNDISWRQIDEAYYLLLSKFRDGISIDAAMEWLEGQEARIYESALPHLQQWFEEWTARGWLTMTSPTELVV